MERVNIKGKLKAIYKQAETCQTHLSSPILTLDSPLCSRHFLEAKDFCYGQNKRQPFDLWCFDSYQLIDMKLEIPPTT